METQTTVGTVGEDTWILNLPQAIEQSVDLVAT